MELRPFSKLDDMIQPSSNGDDEDTCLSQLEPDLQERQPESKGNIVTKICKNFIVLHLLQALSNMNFFIKYFYHNNACFCVSCELLVFCMGQIFTERCM